MIKVFLTSRFNKFPDCDFLKLALSKNSEEIIFGNKIETKNFKNLVEFVSDPVTADYFMLRHDYFLIKKKDKYIMEVDNLLDIYKKKVIIFAYGNSVEEVKVKNSIVLRTSQYKTLLKINEIIVPPFVEDLGLRFGFDPRNFDINRKPIVGFVGTIFSQNLVQWSRYVLKRYLQLLLVSIKKLHSSAVYEGIHFRRKIVGMLKKSSLVDTKLFLKESPIAIKDSDFVLCMKGKGNYSSKFFETLSLGRIPIFIDTDTPLPLENEIDYEAFILRINYQENYLLPKFINSLWQKISNQKFIEMQNNARQAFKYRLSPSGFYRHLFANFEDIVN